MILLLNFGGIFNKDRSHRAYQKYVMVIFEFHTNIQNTSVRACHEIKVFPNLNGLLDQNSNKTI